MRKPKWLVSLLLVSLATLSLNGEVQQEANWVLEFEHCVPRSIILSYVGETETYWYFTYKVSDLDREGMAKLALLDKQIAEKQRLLDEEKIDVQTFKTEKAKLKGEQKVEPQVLLIKYHRPGIVLTSCSTSLLSKKSSGFGGSAPAPTFLTWLQLLQS